METLLSEAVVVTIHTPMTAQTRSLISAPELRRMKAGAIVVNCARGGIVDETALAEALAEGRIAAAALDVFAQEPLEPGSLLRGLSNVVLTPHLAASTEEAQTNVAVEIARQVADALLGRGIRNAVNMPSLDESALRVLQPYIQLGERLGMLGAQLAAGKGSEVHVTYVGDLASRDTSAVTMAILKGILLPVLGESVNYVNAGVLAAERGVKVVESKIARLGDYVNLVSIRLCGGEGPPASGGVPAAAGGAAVEVTVEGTLSARRDPRIVRIDGFPVDAAPSGHLLVIRSEDRPGMIGAIGNLLGEAGVNIAGMTNGRDDSGGNALTVLSLDHVADPEVLRRLRGLPGVRDVQLLHL
jgi:D-3-phosphoglycerate dehydrogenase